jgi:hypothetical protein
MRLFAATLMLVFICACSSGGSSDTASTSGSGSGSSGGSGGSSGSSTGGTGGSCSLIGTWQGTYSCTQLNGVQYTWDIQDGGTAVGQIGTFDTVHQTWSLSGSTMTIVDVSDTSGGPTCGTPGHYAVAFDASCGSFASTRIDDACTNRGDCVDGLHVTRIGGP